MNKTVAFVGLLVLIAVMFSATAYLRMFGEPEYEEMDSYYIENGQNETATNNIVTAVVFDYRGFDTLGEATVLFSAVSGVLVVFRRMIK